MFRHLWGNTRVTKNYGQFVGTINSSVSPFIKNKKGRHLSLRERTSPQGIEKSIKENRLIHDTFLCQVCVVQLNAYLSALRRSRCLSKTPRLNVGSILTTSG